MDGRTFEEDLLLGADGLNVCVFLQASLTLGHRHNLTTSLVSGPQNYCSDGTSSIPSR